MATQTKPVSQARDHLSSDMHALTKHAEELLKATASSTGDGLDQARHQLQSSLDRARSRFDDAESAVIERGRAAAMATETMVKGHPWQSLAAAAGLGAVIGCLAGISLAPHRDSR